MRKQNDRYTLEEVFNKEVVFDYGMVQGVQKEYGKIVGLDQNEWVKQWIVLMEDGRKETITKHSLKPIAEKRSIGAYLI